MSETASEHAALWTASQRRAILLLLAIVTVYLSIRLVQNRAYVSDPQPIDPPRALELADRIDPNTADWQTLAALPMIGEKRARDIIAYRDRYAAINPGKVAFRRIEDLYRVKGFGTAMVAHVQPYLHFPSARTPGSLPASRPAG